MQLDPGLFLQVAAGGSPFGAGPTIGLGFEKHRLLWFDLRESLQLLAAQFRARPLCSRAGISSAATIASGRGGKGARPGVASTDHADRRKRAADQCHAKDRSIRHQLYGAEAPYQATRLSGLRDPLGYGAESRYISG